ncbi:MAG: phosphatase PAP2 family protein [Candidatus Sumerlaeia bacterium]|nr:phosphatase PAP2 family protein [Candidatus Sumerlaeia bacterium]
MNWLAELPRSYPVAFPASLFLILLGFGMIPVELIFNDELMRFMKEYLDHENFFMLGKFFASTAGIVLGGALILFLCQNRHSAFPRIIVGSYVAGLFNILLKIVFSRERPEYNRKKDFIAEVPLEEMGRFFVAWRQDLSLLLNSDYWSFPSGHSTVAGFLMMGYCTYYPKASPLFVALGILCIGSRVMDVAHFPSDVLVGMGQGMLFWMLLQQTNFLEKAWRRVLRVS